MCTTVFSDAEWKAIYIGIHKKSLLKGATLPSEPPTLSPAVVLLARLGGFLARKGNCMPAVAVPAASKRSSSSGMSLACTPLRFDGASHPLVRDVFGPGDRLVSEVGEVCRQPLHAALHGAFRLGAASRPPFRLATVTTVYRSCQQSCGTKLSRRDERWPSTSCRMQS